MLYALRRAQGVAGSTDVRARAPDSAAGTGRPESQLGVPLLVRGELVGVLCIESEMPYRFHEEDKTSIELLGSYLAIAIQNMQMQERGDDAAAGAVPGWLPSRRAVATSAADGAAAGRHEVVYYSTDECVFVDGEYLIRSLPGEDPVEAAVARTTRQARRVHQPRAAARQVAQPAGVEGQPREPAAAAAPAARAEVPDIRLVPARRGALRSSCAGRCTSCASHRHTDGRAPEGRVARARWHTGDVATVYINEVRRFALPTPAVLEIVLQFDRESGGTVWRRPILDAAVSQSPEPNLRVTMHARGSEPPEEQTFEATTIAAALIRYFEKARVPLSRTSRKSMEIVDNELVLTLESRVPVVLTPGATATRLND